MRALAPVLLLLALLMARAGMAADHLVDQLTEGSFTEGSFTSFSHPGPPDIRFVFPLNGSSVNGTIIVQVSANDSDGMSRLEIRLDGYSEYLNTSNMNLFNWSWNTSTTYNGPHELIASGLDKAGGQNSTKIAVVVNNTVNDAIEPMVAITWPANGSKVSDRVPVVVNASDDKKLIQVTFFIDGARQQRNRTGASPFNFLWDTSDPPNGSHEISAEAIDQAGNRNVSKITVILDNDRTKPSVSVLEPTNGAGVKGPVAVRGQAADDRMLSHVDLYVDGNFSAANSTGSGGVYGFAWDSTTVAAGPHRLALVAIDGRGNSATATVNVTVEPQDNEGPTVKLLKPADQSDLRRTVEVLADASDPSGVAKVEFLVDGALLAIVVQAPYNVSWDTRDAANGARVLAARATDTLGYSNLASIIVLVQNAKPPVIISPKADEKVYGFWKINGSAPAGTIAVEVSADENPWQPAQFSGGIWEVGWNTANISAGKHVLHARTFDGIDHSAQSSIDVMVVRPVAVILAPDEGDTITANFTILGSSQYSLRVEVSIDGGATWETAKAIDPWNLSWETRATLNGPYRILARAWDGASYSRNASVNVTVANPTPGVTVPPEAGGLVALLIILAIVAVLVIVSRRKPGDRAPLDETRDEDEEVAAEAKDGGADERSERSHESEATASRGVQPRRGRPGETGKSGR